MSDFESLVAGLRSDVAARLWPDAGRIRARGSRRATRRAVGLATVLLVFSAGVAVAVHRSGPAGPPTGIVPSMTPAQPTVTPTPGPSDESAGPTATPLAGFAARDLTFVGPAVGWLLGTTPCPTGSCLTIVHTTDGGRSWTKMPAPPADLQALGAGIRFGNERTGYLYSPDALYMTSDGGATWQKQPGHAMAMEIAGGTVLRISTTTPGCPPGCTYQISRAQLGSTGWRTVMPDAGEGVGVQLLRSGRRAVAAIYPNLVGGARMQGVWLTSGDSGGTWTTWPDPCGKQEAPAASSGMTVADDESITLLCSSSGGDASFVMTSIDGGLTFGPPRAAPGFTLTIGGTSATTLFAAVLEGRTIRLYRSGAGATWTAVAQAPDPTPDGDVPANLIGFQNALTGSWLPGQTTVFTTTDGGTTWSPYTFS